MYVIGHRHIFCLLSKSTILLDAYILRAVAEHLQKAIEDTTIVIMHLGSGASVCAVKNGKSIDTSMGLTPVEGLPGATRSGGVDPSMIFHYTSEASKLSHSATSEMRITEVCLNELTTLDFPDLVV